MQQITRNPFGDLTAVTYPTPEELHALFEIKYGHPSSTGWSPRQRLEFGYFTPDDVYEAIVARLVDEHTIWLDVGGGRALFPSNPKLSARLSAKCAKLVAVDPSKNVLENPYAAEKHIAMVEDFETSDTFNLATFRMVAEHISDPVKVLERLSGLMKQGGLVVIYTINKFSPVSLATYLTPFSWHYRVKKLLWGGEERDTFPVQYKMNTRHALDRLFSSHGFEMMYFGQLDDLSFFKEFKMINRLDLSLWKTLRHLGLKYPENNLLGVYKKK